MTAEVLDQIEELIKNNSLFERCKVTLDDRFYSDVYRVVIANQIIYFDVRYCSNHITYKREYEELKDNKLFWKSVRVSFNEVFEMASGDLKKFFAYHLDVFLELDK